MLIVGLGNPDKKYESTYHNVGFMAADRLSDNMNEKFKNKECKSLTISTYVGGKRVVIAKPQTYMNLSGEAVIDLLGKYQHAPQDAIIIFDDIDLPCGDIRMRKDGSGGTHNGMKNIVGVVGSKDIPRIRIGIGKPTPPMQLIDYVVSKVSGENVAKIRGAVDKVAAALKEYIACWDMDKLMRDLNG